MIDQPLFCIPYNFNNKRVSSMGGAFLSQPVTKKRINKYQHGKIRVITCEMQGNSCLIKAGESTWKTHYSSTVSIRKPSSLRYSTDTEELRSRSSVPKNCHKCWRVMRTSSWASTGKPWKRPSKHLMSYLARSTEKNYWRTSQLRTVCSPLRTAKWLTQSDALPT